MPLAHAGDGAHAETGRRNAPKRPVPAHPLAGVPPCTNGPVSAVLDALDGAPAVGAPERFRRSGASRSYRRGPFRAVLPRPLGVSGEPFCRTPGVGSGGASPGARITVSAPPLRPALAGPRGEAQTRARPRAVRVVRGAGVRGYPKFNRSSAAPQSSPAASA